MIKALRVILVFAARGFIVSLLFSIGHFLVVADAYFTGAVALAWYGADAFEIVLHCILKTGFLLFAYFAFFLLYAELVKLLWTASDSIADAIMNTKQSR